MKRKDQKQQKKIAPQKVESHLEREGKKQKTSLGKKRARLNKGIGLVN